MKAKDFNNWLFDQHWDQWCDEVFKQHRVKQELKGLTWSWTNRFDSAKLHERFGLTTGANHFLELCSN